MKGTCSLKEQLGTGRCFLTRQRRRSENVKNVSRLQICGTSFHIGISVLNKENGDKFETAGLNRKNPQRKVRSQFRKEKDDYENCSDL